MSFEDLKLNPAIIKAILDAGYTTPTPIQKQAIPELLSGHDIMASAQTGTGKTAAFMLPALHLLASSSQTQGRGPRVLVLTPTRELALQVSEAAKKIWKIPSSHQSNQHSRRDALSITEQTAVTTSGYPSGHPRTVN